MNVAIDDLEIWQAPKIEQLRPGHSRIAIGPATVHPLCFLLQQRRKRPNSGPAACRIKISRCSKRTSRALRFLLRTLLLLSCHNATPWFLMNLIRQGLSSRLRRQTTAKQWCIINERRMNRPPRAVSVDSHPKADQRRRARDQWTTCLPPIRSRRSPRAARDVSFRFGAEIPTRHRGAFARITAGQRPSSAPTSMSNEPRRHFRVLLDRTESP